MKCHSKCQSPLHSINFVNREKLRKILSILRNKIKEIGEYYMYIGSDLVTRTRVVDIKDESQ